MEENIEQPIGVYVRVNENREIVEVNSNIFIKDLTGWIKIDEGFGDKYAHAQSQYFRELLLNENGSYNYKYVDGKIIKNKIQELEKLI